MGCATRFSSIFLTSIDHARYPSALLPNIDDNGGVHTRHLFVENMVFLHHICQKPVTRFVGDDTPPLHTR